MFKRLVAILLILASIPMIPAAYIYAKEVGKMVETRIYEEANYNLVASRFAEVAATAGCGYERPALPEFKRADLVETGAGGFYMPDKRLVQYDAEKVHYIQHEIVHHLYGEQEYSRPCEERVFARILTRFFPEEDLATMSDARAQAYLVEIFNYTYRRFIMAASMADGSNKIAGVKGGCLVPRPGIVLEMNPGTARFGTVRDFAFDSALFLFRQFEISDRCLNEMVAYSFVGLIHTKDHVNGK